MFTFYCASVKIDSGSQQLPNIEFGLFTAKKYFVVNNNTFRVRDGCSAFHADRLFDSQWKAARAFGCITVLLGGFAVLTSIFGPMCRGLSESSWKILAGLYIVVLPFFQGLTFLMFRSKICSGEARFFNFMNDGYGNCQWNSGSTANVFGIFLWFLAGGVMLVLGAPDNSETQGRESPAPTKTPEVGVAPPADVEVQSDN